MLDLGAWFSTDEIERVNPLLEKADHAGWLGWVRTRSDYRALLDGFSVDLRLSHHFREFCERNIVQVSGDHAGKPFTFMDWQWNDLFGPLFGWCRSEKGKLRRRFKRGFVFVPKKNGKSTSCAAMALYMLCADGEPEAKCYVAANSREQAGQIWEKAVSYIEASPTLPDVLKIGRGVKKTIACLSSKSYLRPISAEGRTNAGIDAHFVIYDELHDSRNDRLFNTLEYAGRARSQPLCPFVITTAGDDPSPENICFRQYQLTKKIAQGEIERVDYFPLIYEALANADPGDESAWSVANPSLGELFTQDATRADFLNARDSGGLANFRRHILNLWVPHDEDRWIPRAKWDTCKGDFPEGYQQLPCFIGVDLSRKSDFTALVLVWVDEDRYYVSPRFWLPSESFVRRVRKGQTELMQWKEDNYLEVMPGPHIDGRVVEQAIREACTCNDVRAIAFDERFADPIAAPLFEDGLPVVYVGQGVAHLSGPMKHVEGAILTGRITHDGNEIMGWMFGNVVPVRDRNDNIHPNKGRSVDRIDGVSALVTAMSRVLVIEEKFTPWVASV